MSARALTALLLGAALGAAAPPAAPPAKPEWTVARTEKLADGLEVTLSPPVAVARSKGYLWFPGLARAADGQLLAVMNDYADVDTLESTCKTAWSADGGLTWSAPVAGPYGESPLRLANGDLQLLPYYLHPRKDGIGAPYRVAKKGTRELKTVEPGLVVTGWPRPPGVLDTKFDRSGFVFNGQTMTLKDGGYLATLYGKFQGQKRYALVAAESADGAAWKIRSVVADETCKLAGAEGPCESAVVRLKDQRLLCVFRTDSNVPYGHCFSADDGKTWTEPAALPAGVRSVQPSLAVLPAGTIALTGGRPGLFLWLDVGGRATAWQAVDLMKHHNATVPAETIRSAGHTTSYTEVVAVDDATLLVIYDRIPHGWHPVPKDSADTNSVWVVRVGLRRPR